MARHARFPGLIRRRGRWSYRRRFPGDVAAVLKRAEFQKYIGGDRSFAEVEIAAHAAALEFAEVCCRARTDPSETVKHAALELFAVADSARHQLARVSGPDADDFDADDLPRDDINEDELDLKALRRLRNQEKFVAATRQEVTELRAKDAAKGRKIADAIAAWVERQNPRKPAINQMRRWAERLKETGAPDDVAAVTTRHVARFVAAIERDASYSRQTAAHGLSRLKTLWGHAIAREMTDTNPFASARVASARQHTFEPAAPEGFTPAETRQILASVGTLPDDAAWLLRLAIWHGARISDLSNLKRQDVQPDRLILRGALKNAQSARVLPLSPQCVDFYAYAQSQTAKDGDPVWEGNNPANAAQKLYTAFFRGLNVAARAHGARHGWIAASIRQGCPDHISRAITGHARGKTAHDRYGTPATFADMKVWIEKVDPTLD